MVLGVKSRPRRPPETSQLEKAGRSRNIGRWLRSSPRRQQQPDTFALPICGPVGPRRQNIPVSLGDDDNNTDHNTPVRLRAWRGFCVLGRSYLPRISGKGSHCRQSERQVYWPRCADFRRSPRGEQSAREDPFRSLAVRGSAWFSAKGVGPVQFLGLGAASRCACHRGGAAAGAFCASAPSVTGLTAVAG